MCKSKAEKIFVVEFLNREERRWHGYRRKERKRKALSPTVQSLAAVAEGKEQFVFYTVYGTEPVLLFKRGGDVFQWSVVMKI